MASILIVGYGNPLRSDDGLGWLAAEELSRTLAIADCEVLTRHQLTPELADDLKDANAVFFIDAAHVGEPGEITCQPVVEVSGPIRSHYFSPASLLGMTRELYGASPRAFAISMCGECFDFGAHCSATVEAALPKLVVLLSEMAAQVGSET